MSKIAFIVDSASGIKNGQYDNVYVLPLIITIKDGNGNVKDYKDGVDIDETQTAKAIENKKCDVKTSQASVGELINMVESIQDDYDKIYVIPIHPKISNSLNTWNMIKEDYPKLCILPTTDFTCGVIWDIEHLLSLAKANKLTDDVALEYMANIHKHRNGLLFVYDLTQLAKGGRISNFKAALAKLFKMKIIISADNDGLNFIDKSASMEKCVAKAFEYFKKHNANFDAKNVTRLGLIYSEVDRSNKNIKVAIDAIKDLLKGAKYKEDKYIFPNVLMAHTGGNMFAFYIEFN